jgi:hypothetical protein
MRGLIGGLRLAKNAAANVFNGLIPKYGAVGGNLRHVAHCCT